jgi:WXG100 family type VII secretion target
VSDLQVTASELVAVSAELNSLTESLRSGLGALDSDVSGLLGAGWTGSAASSYSGVWQEWHQGASQVVEGLSRMSGLLQEAAAHYSSTDTATAADISGTGL